MPFGQFIPFTKWIKTFFALLLISPQCRFYAVPKLTSFDEFFIKISLCFGE